MKEQESTLKTFAVFMAAQKIYDSEGYKIGCQNIDEAIVLSYLTHFNKLGIKGMESITFPENFKLSKI
jgi:hypothetical protein